MSATDAAPTPIAMARRRMTGARRSRWARGQRLGVADARDPVAVGRHDHRRGDDGAAGGRDADLVHARRSASRRRATGGAPSGGWGRSRPWPGSYRDGRSGAGPRRGRLARMQRPFAQVDVFTTGPGLGNPLAVVLDGTGLTTAEMQRFARWTNLSETTFVLPPDDPGRGLPGADLHAGRRAAVRRPPDARHVPRVARGGRRPARPGADRPGVRRGLVDDPADGDGARVRRASPAPLRTRGRGGPRGDRGVARDRRATRSSTRSGATTDRAG